MSKGNVNLQDSFLNQVRRDNAEVKLALIDGTVLRGNVRGFDNFTIALNVGGMQHLVYKHAIAQLVARRAPRREGQPGTAVAIVPAGEPGANGAEVESIRENLVEPAIDDPEHTTSSGALD